MRVEARCATQCTTVDAASSSGGQTIPLKWRLTDARSAAVTRLENADLLVVELGCAPGSSAVGREVEGELSELTRLGDGDYQLDLEDAGELRGLVPAGAARPIRRQHGDPALPHRQLSVQEVAKAGGARAATSVLP
jgi:hypothetical protein